MPSLDVHIGMEGRLIERFYLCSGKRSAFLRDLRLFTVSPDMQRVSGVRHPQAVFFRALEDRPPDARGNESA